MLGLQNYYLVMISYYGVGDKDMLINLSFQHVKRKVYITSKIKFAVLMEILKSSHDRDRWKRVYST